MTNISQKIKAGGIAIVVIGGTLFLIIKDKNQVQIPQNIRSIGQLAIESPRAFEVAEKIYEIYKKTNPSDNACNVGLYPNKIGDKDGILILEALGYIKRVNRGVGWNAVIIPCDKANKLIVEMDQFYAFVDAQITSSTVTVVGESLATTTATST